METIVHFFIENAKPEVLRSILSSIDEDVVAAAIAASLGYYGPARAGDCKPTTSNKTIKEELHDDAIQKCIDEMEIHCHREITRATIPMLSLVNGIIDLKTEKVGKIVAVRWLRNATSCSLQDALLVVNMIFNDPCL